MRLGVDSDRDETPVILRVLVYEPPEQFVHGREVRPGRAPGRIAAASDAGALAAS